MGDGNVSFAGDMNLSIEIGWNCQHHADQPSSVGGRLIPPKGDLNTRHGFPTGLHPEAE